MVPMDTDICICMDLDEVLLPNWREELEKKWSKDITRVRYVYNWSLDKNNKPIVSFYGEKIHSRKNFKWTHPVHEILKYEGEEKYLFTDNIIINHYPDTSKSRSSYLKLLELSFKEEPNDDRNMHYLGREYMYYERWNDAIDVLERHLNLPNATWKDERCASARFIARSYSNLGRNLEAKMWYDIAINEAPYLRDPYVEKAMFLYKIGEYKDIKKLLKKALKINDIKMSYINEPFTLDGPIYDLLSVMEFEDKNYKKSFYYVKKAKKLLPSDSRVSNNYDIIKKKVRDEVENKSRCIE